MTIESGGGAAATAAFKEGFDAALTKALRIISDHSTACKRDGRTDAMYAINTVWHAISALFPTEPIATSKKEKPRAVPSAAALSGRGDK